MNVSLGKKQGSFVEDKVDSGDYQTASKVLRDGLRLLEKEALLKKIPVHSLPELAAKLLKAADSLDAGLGVDAEQVFTRLRQRSKSGGKIDSPCNLPTPSLVCLNENSGSCLVRDVFHHNNR